MRITMPSPHGFTTHGFTVQHTHFQTIKSRNRKTAKASFTVQSSDHHIHKSLTEIFVEQEKSEEVLIK